MLLRCVQLLFAFILPLDLRAQIIKSPECLAAEEACHENEDCLHRLTYLHGTCITGRCQPQCKVAVLNLYQVACFVLLLFAVQMSEI